MRVDPPKPIASTLDQKGESRVPSLSRLEARRQASGADTKSFNVIFTLDGAGEDFVPDLIGSDFTCDIACTLSRIRFWDADGGTPSINFDLWKKKFADGKPTIADTVLPAPIAIVATDRYSDQLLANVNRAFVMGDVMKLFINTASGFSRGVVALTFERSI